MNAPVILLIFNRPPLTERVFKKIAEVKPPKLFLVADGPREGNEEDAAQLAEGKRIVENVDWDCEAYYNYSDINLGCGIRVATGISWAFEHVDRAIILEDDCLPDPSFFQFCEELLERYKDDERIMNISGTNLQGGQNPTETSYYYSRYPFTWGWATWRRAWKYYDYHLALWEELRETRFPAGITGNEEAAKYLRHHFEMAFRKGPPEDYRSWDYTYTWDYQWAFACFVQQGLSVIPDRDLISNIGFGASATHTKNDNHQYASLPAKEMKFPLVHPQHKLVNREADYRQFRLVGNSLKDIKKKKKGYGVRVKNRIMKILRRLNISN